MTLPQRNHQGIYIRNFLTIFVCISLVGYIHFQLNQATSVIQTTNQIVSSILNNDTYSITQQRLDNLEESLKSKQYFELSQAECLVRIYLDVLNNERFVAETLEKADAGSAYFADKIELNFSELVFPTSVHDLQGFRSCGDILTMMNFLNPVKTDFIYTNFMQQKYGQFVSQQQVQVSKIEAQEATPTQKQSKFCIISHQTNTSRTKLRQNLNSIIEQSYQDYKLIIVDNGSSDGSYQIAKVILQDLKEKLIKENVEQEKQINEKYQIIHEESRLGVWELLGKYDSKCQGMDYLVVIDGRDQLATRHVLNIMNRNIISSKQNPSLITAPILKKHQLARQAPATTHMNNSRPNSSFTFKVISIDLYNNLKEKVLDQTHGITHSLETQRVSLQILIEYCQFNNKSILEIDEMLYVYDSIQNKQIDRNQYYVAIARKDIEKNGKKGNK